MDEEKTRDLKDVIRAESARGTRKRVPDPDAVKEKRLRIEVMRELLQQNNKGEFLKVLTGDFGLQPGSEEYNLALQAWNEYHRQRV